MIFVILVGLLAISLLIAFDISKPRGYPPGPRWLPVLGNYLLVCEQLRQFGFHHLVWANLATQYGPVVGLRLGRDRIVIVSGYEAIREVVSREEFDGRPDGFFFRLRAFGQRLGVVFVDGPLWVEQRRFSLRHLRNFGYGKHGMERQIAEEASELVASLRQQCNNDSAIIPMHQAFDICVLNSLWTMLAGQRFALDDEQLKKLLNLVHASFRMLDMSGGLLNQMPFLSVIAPHQSGYADLVKYLHEMWDFLRKTIHEHHRTRMPGVSRDLIDAFLQEMEHQPDSTFTENQLITVCLDLFMAGSETTSNTMEYAILYMLLYPEVQKKIHEELDAVVGRSRLPMFEDRQRLCYVEAVIMEVQRRVSVAPVAVPHRATKDTVLMGHVVPQIYSRNLDKSVFRIFHAVIFAYGEATLDIGMEEFLRTMNEDTTVLISIWSLHMDVEHWGDPEAFRPDRFLDAEGKIIQDDWFVPFGYGRRRCLGEILARKGLFLFFATLLHTFSVSVPAGHPPPSPVGYDGITLSPKPFYAEFTPRF